MSAPSDPRFDTAAATDDAVLAAHERAVAPPGNDDHAHYRLLPLIMLFVTSGFILFAATYLNRYGGHFDSTVYNENAGPSKGAVAAAVDPVAMGKRLFNSGGACYTCHQPTGQGIPGVYPPLAGSEWVQGPEDRVIRIVLTGLKGPVTVKGATFNAAQMPAFGPNGFNWSDEKISQVLTYVRQEWGNKAPPISADKVAAIRAAIGDHKEWTAEELEQIK